MPTTPRVISTARATVVDPFYSGTHTTAGFVRVLGWLFVVLMVVCSGIGSADFQLPFPLSSHETSSSEWLPRPVMAPFECLTFSFVQWNYGGKCLAANSGKARSYAHVDVC